MVYATTASVGLQFTAMTFTTVQMNGCRDFQNNDSWLQLRIKILKIYYNVPISIDVFKISPMNQLWGFRIKTKDNNNSVMLSDILKLGKWYPIIKWLTRAYSKQIFWLLQLLGKLTNCSGCLHNNILLKRKCLLFDLTFFFHNQKRNKRKSLGFVFIS